MATWEAIKPAPPVINTFFGSYGISLSLSFFYDDVFAFSQKDGFNNKFAVLTDLFCLTQKSQNRFRLKNKESVFPPFILKTRFARPRDAQIASSIIRF